ncbi:hypothetical protein [Chroococcidiopsis sp.]|uniref:hypothetical protein n=1 Tax=Chroococcidiopsis sp. TaxID=3088168 RepID=UPI003F2C3B74
MRSEELGEEDRLRDLREQVSEETIQNPKSKIQNIPTLYTLHPIPYNLLTTLLPLAPRSSLLAPH